MAGGMKIQMSLLGASDLKNFLSGQVKQKRVEVGRAVKDVTVKWQMEAKLRVPVDTGFLRNSILREDGLDSQGFYGAVGSNAKYATFTEFGNQYIADGAVEALGTGPDVTDAQAVKVWPAKQAKIGNANVGKDGRLREATGKFATGTQTRTQMPWLRTSFNAIREWAINRIAKAVKFER